MIPLKKLEEAVSIRRQIDTLEERFASLIGAAPSGLTNRAGRREMKVKVFFGTNADQLTKDIQAWLDSDGVEVTAACQSQGTRTGEEGVFVTVFYK